MKLYKISPNRGGFTETRIIPYLLTLIYTTGQRPYYENIFIGSYSECKKELIKSDSTLIEYAVITPIQLPF